MARQTIAIPASEFRVDGTGIFLALFGSASVPIIPDLRANRGVEAFFGTVAFNTDGAFQLDIARDRSLTVSRVDLSSMWETSGSLTLTAGTNTLRLTPNDTSDPYNSWNEAASTIAAFYTAVGRAAQEFTLTLDDGALPDAAAPSVTINAIPAGREGTTVKLSATLGDDGTHDGAVEYAWKVSGGALDDATLAEPTLTRPQVSAASDFTADLTITARGTGTNAKDGTSDTASASRVTFRVTDTPAAATTVVASAGDDKTVASGGKVTLDGSAVVTNGVGATFYAWQRISGSGGALHSTRVAKPEFTAPVLAAGGSDREIVWRMLASNNGVSDSDDVTVTVEAPAPPALAAPNFADDTGDDAAWTKDTEIAAIVVPAATGNPVPVYAPVGALPAGIKFDAATRTLSGTPSATGEGTITIRATNSQGADDWTLKYKTTEQQANSFTGTLGNPGTSFSVFIRWEGLSVTIPGVFFEDGVARNLEEVQLLSSSRRTSFRIVGTADLTSKWEKFNPALIIQAGAVRLELPGPDNETVASRDASEPYTWSLAAGDNRIATFITAFRALPESTRRATTFTLQDGVPPAVEPELPDLVAAVTLGRPLVEVEAIGRAVTTAATLSRPYIDVEAIPAALRTLASLSRPYVHVEAIPNALTAVASLARLDVNTDILTRTRLKVDATLSRPIVLIDPEFPPLVAAATLGRPIVAVDPEFPPLRAVASLGRPIVEVEPLLPPLVAVARLSRPLEGVVPVPLQVGGVFVEPGDGYIDLVYEESELPEGLVRYEYQIDGGPWILVQ